MRGATLLLVVALPLRGLAAQHEGMAMGDTSAAMRMMGLADPLAPMNRAGSGTS